MRLLVLGGTFNPVHLGHLMLAEEIASEFSYDRVAFVPSFLPPHKILMSDPGPEARLGMVRAAIEGDPSFIVEDCELKRGGLSFTLDTLDYIVRAYGLEGKPGLVIGDDLARGFGDWRDPSGISARADVIIARRSGTFAPFEYPHRRAANMILPISSTDIRARIAEGRPWHRLVPTTVARFIEENGLYRNA